MKEDNEEQIEDTEEIATTDTGENTDDFTVEEAAE